MNEVIFGLVLIVIIFAAVLFGVAVGCHAAKKDKTDEFFLKRDNYRSKIKELKKQLEKSEEIRNDLHKDNVALRLELGEVTEEAAELRYKLRRLETAKERGNDGK